MKPLIPTATHDQQEAPARSFCYRRPFGGAVNFRAWSPSSSSCLASDRIYTITSRGRSSPTRATRSSSIAVGFTDGESRCRWRSTGDDRIGGPDWRSTKRFEFRAGRSCRWGTRTRRTYRTRGRFSICGRVHHPRVPNCVPAATSAVATASRPNQSIATDPAGSPVAAVCPTSRRHRAGDPGEGGGAAHHGWSLEEIARPPVVSPPFVRTPGASTNATRGSGCTEPRDLVWSGRPDSTGDVQLGKSFATDRLVSHGIPNARSASGGCLHRGLGEGNLPTFCQKIVREPRPSTLSDPL